MSTSTIVNNTFNAVYDGLRARPVSHFAASVFLGTSIYVAHEGLMRWAPGNLGTALTALFCAAAVLQWLAMGRKDACEDAKDFDRADAVIHQAWMFGVIETVLYCLGGLSLAEVALDAWSITAGMIGGGIFAFCNFRVKWVSCDNVRRRGRPTTGGTPLDVQVQSADLIPVLEQIPNDWADDQKVISFVERMRRASAFTDRDLVALAQDTRGPAERLRLATKRITTRHQRGEQRKVA